MTRDKYVQHPDLELIDTLAKHSGYYGQTWCYPAQDTLCELHAKRTGRRMSRRTVDRHLKALRDRGYIRQIRRHYLAPRVVDLVVERLRESGEPETPTQVAIYIEACVRRAIARERKRKIKMEKGK